MIVTELWHYPVKSLRGNRLQTARLTPTGFEHDRRWMVVDAGGNMVTQRTVPRMAALAAQAMGGVLRLADPARPGDICRVPLTFDAEPREVRVWSDRVLARPTHPAAHAWLTKSLGVECMLVESIERRSELAEVAFPDDAPITIASEASLAALNATLKTPVTMARFRPNIVVDGEGAWDEERWTSVRVGFARMRTPKLCKRCTMLDVDPRTGLAGDGVLAALKVLRSDARGRPLFAVKAACDDPRETIALGDRVIVDTG